MTTARNDITGDALVSKKPTDSYRDGWDRIFGTKQPNIEWSDHEEIEEDLNPDLHTDNSTD